MAKKPQSFLEQIEEKYSHLLITDDKEHEIRAIHTGSLSLDYSTGIGGIPIARFTEIYGPESSGKTTLCLTIAKNCIESGGKVLYVDAENGLDYDRVREIVGDVGDSFIMLQPQYAEETFMLAEEGINNGGFGLIILDSIAVLASKGEMEKEFEKESMTILSRMISKFIKRNTYAIRDSDTAFIFVNQVRDKIGAYVPTLEAPGGHAVKHICSLRIMLQADMSKDGRIMNGEEVIGAYTKFTIKKNKLAAPLRASAFPILFNSGIDFVRDAVIFSEVIGVLTKAGSYFRFEDENLGQGLNNTIEYLTENKLVLDKIVNMCYTKMVSTNQLEEERTDDETVNDNQSNI